MRVSSIHIDLDSQADTVVTVALELAEGTRQHRNAFPAAVPVEELIATYVRSGRFVEWPLVEPDAVRIT